MGERRADRPGLVAAACDALLSVLFAAPCAACHQLLEQPTRGPVCAACWHAIPPIDAAACDGCGGPLPPGAPPFALCPRCRRGFRAVDRARAAGLYDGALKAIVHALKYEGRRSLAKPLARLMADRGADLLSGAAAAVPVPLHPSRRRHRGFNQAADLAAHIGLPVVHALSRVRATAVQADLPAARRSANVRDAFAANRQTHRLEGQVAVLIDDVSTTGATLDACARTLKAAGLREVRALTAARVAAPPL